MALDLEGSSSGGVISGGGAPSGGGASSSSWTTLYEKDLRELPDQVVVSSGQGGTYALRTIDGVSWGIHSAQQNSVNEPIARLKTGVGLIHWFDFDKLPGMPYGGIFSCIRVFALPGYDAAKETCVQVRLYRGPDLNKTVFGGAQYTFEENMQNIGHVGACGWSGGESWGYGPGGNHETEYFDGAQLRVRDANVQDQTKNPLSFMTRPAPNGVIDKLRDWVLGVKVTPWSMEPTQTSDSLQMRNERSYLYARHCFKETFPAVEDMQTMVTLKKAADGSGYANHHLGAFFGDSGVNACAIQQIRVLQRPHKVL